MRPVTTPRRCRATTRKGTICAITSSSTLKNDIGREVAEPLRRGGDHCLFHSQPFATRPADCEGAIILVFIDLESTGLDLSLDRVVEIAASEAPSCPWMRGAAFATVVSTDAAGGTDPASQVHGISSEEIALGPSFPTAWARFVVFVDNLANLALHEYSDDSDVDPDEVPPRPPSELPKLLLAAHNGISSQDLFVPVIGV